MSAPKKRNPNTKGQSREAAQPSSTPSAEPLFSRYAVFVALAAVGLRLWGIGTDFPIITDEAIYLRWAEIIEHQGQWLISLFDGKPPLSYWIYALARFVWDGDPLVASRSLSALAGGGTAWLLFAIGRRLHSARAGLAAAAAYAVFPWAMVHDRFGLAEALIAFGGAAVVSALLWSFEDERHALKRHALKRDALVGLVFGLVLFTKTTAILFAPAVLLVGWISSGGAWQLRAVRLGRIFGVAALFPLLSVWLTPETSTLGTTSAVLHETSRFVSWSEFVSNPFSTLVEYRLRFVALIDYVTWPGLAFGLGALAYFTRRRSAVAWLFWSACVLPVLVQVLVLQTYEARYAYPHAWPWMLLLGAGWSEAARAAEGRFPARPKLAAALIAAIFLGPMAVRSGLILSDPEAHINRYESGRYFGSYPHVGFGVPEAVAFLRNEARNRGGLTLLTVPLWGVPADAFSAYLNQRDGIRVYEAWWLQLEGGRPIMPSGQAEIIRSHYERVSAGRIDFQETPAVYFATDSELMARAQVAARQPGARLVASFPKPDGASSIDVYRLK